MINWPAFRHGFKLLGVAAILSLLSFWNAVDESTRRAIVSNLMFFFLAAFIFNVVADAIHKQIPVKEVIKLEESDETETV